MNRKSISNKLRFEVLNRDKFSCQYCGRNAKDGAKLEIDHIIPVSKGGTNHIDNLKTSCFLCNRGKKAIFNWKELKNKEITPGIIDAISKTDWKIYADDDAKYKRHSGFCNATGMTEKEAFDYIDRIYKPLIEG